MAVKKTGTYEEEHLKRRKVPFYANTQENHYIPGADAQEISPGCDRISHKLDLSICLIRSTEFPHLNKVRCKSISVTTVTVK
jgi:hypothetical protein